MSEKLLAMMQKMDPVMAPLFWVGVVFAVLGFLFLLARYSMKLSTGKATVWSTRIVIALGLFFIIAHFLGTFLGMDMPYINFGDPAKFQFIKGHFWVLGSGLVLAALVLKLLSRSKGDGAA